MITTAKLEKPRIPIEIFKKMVETLSPAELGNLPPEKLPINIPHELIEAAPMETQAVLEDLLFAAEAHQMNERMDIEDHFGADVAQAVELSRQGGSATLNKMFKGRITQLQELHASWEQSSSKEELHQLIEHIHQLDDLLPHVRDESAAITRGCNALQALEGAGKNYEAVFVEARESLVDQVQEVDECLGEYFVLRLMVMGVELQRTAVRVSSMDQEMEHIVREIDTLNQRIESIIKTQKLSPAEVARNHEVQNLRDELVQLQEQRQQNDVLISEQDLIDWLDVIVDASLSPKGNIKLEGKTKDVRMALFQLLVRYCKSQEDAARQVADNPFSQQDPEQVIRFMLKSEKFVLDYFANKRKNLTEWLGDAARKKMDTLKDLEDNMITVVRERMQGI